jgi:hypothetical protein
MTRRIRLFFVAIIAAFSGHFALQAQGWGSIDISIPMANTGYILSQQIVTAAYDEPRTPKPSKPSPTAKAPPPPKRDSSTLITRTPAARSAAPGQLAASYPAAERASAQNLFGKLLDQYDPLMRQLGVPRDDYAGAAAAFVAGSYTAYHGRDFDDRAFAPLVRDIRARLSQNDQFGAAALSDKQAAFDQYAILGMMTAGTHIAIKQMPPGPERDKIESNLREAGKHYLEQVFGVPADKIVIDASGLSY